MLSDMKDATMRTVPFTLATDTEAPRLPVRLVHGVGILRGLRAISVRPKQGKGRGTAIGILAVTTAMNGTKCKVRHLG